MVIAPASDRHEGVDFESLARYLGERAGIDIELHYCKDYQEAIAALRRGDAEIGWLGAYAYMEAARDSKIEAFAVGVLKGRDSPSYHSDFIVPADSPIRMLSDIRHQRIAISDRFSTSGYLIPKQELREVGIDLDNAAEFSEVLSVHDHDEAIRCVLDDRADVAAVSSVNLEKNIEEGVLDPAAFRVIHRSRAIPGAPLVYATRLPAELRQTLKRSVLEAHRHLPIGGYGGAMDRYLDPKESHRSFLEQHLKSQWGWRTHLSLGLFVLVTLLVLIDLEVDPVQLVKASSVYLVDVIGRMLPPDFSKLGTLLSAMLETIEIGFLGTVLAVAISIPISLCSARNIVPNYLVYLVARTITIFFRAVPEFIMAMILVIAVGFGALPGVIALGLHTMGFLAKFYAEDMEHVQPGPMEALAANGASRMQVLTFAVIPQILPEFVKNNLYILDRNIRMATMLGIVGAGGIGYELLSSFRMFEYQRVSAIIIIIFVTIFIIDHVSAFIRSRIQ